MYATIVDSAPTAERHRARAYLDEQLIAASHPYGEGPAAQAAQDALLAEAGGG